MYSRILATSTNRAKVARSRLTMASASTDYGACANKGRPTGGNCSRLGITTSPNSSRRRSYSWANSCSVKKLSIAVRFASKLAVTRTSANRVRDLGTIFDSRDASSISPALHEHSTPGRPRRLPILSQLRAVTTNEFAHVQVDDSDRAAQHRSRPRSFRHFL
jgi:hypothetical protein